MSFLSSLKLGASKCLLSIAWIVTLIHQGASMARAQCPVAEWLPGMGMPGTNDDVIAVTSWDRDGAGPLAPVLVVGGDFTLAGEVPANRIAAYDPATGHWSALGSGMNNTVWSIATLANGDLVAGGRFTTAGGITANRIARWNGTSWTSLGTGMSAFSGNAGVYALAAVANGELIAGGTFSSAGGVPTTNVARWNGVNWVAMASSMSPSGSTWVSSLSVEETGDLIMGGIFQAVGAIQARNVARWNGTSWSAVGTGLDFPVLALMSRGNGDIVAGGQIGGNGTSQFMSSVTRWNGVSWSPLGERMFWSVRDFAELTTGDLLTAADGGIFSWNGADWSIHTAPNSPSGSIESMSVFPNGEIFAGGWFSTIGSSTASNVARRSGESWLPLGSGTNGSVRAIGQLPNGDFVAGGGFSMLAGTSANNIAIGNANGWTACGAGVNGQVFAITALSNNDVIAGGNFATAGGAQVNGIARWDGTGWASLGAGTSGSVSALLTIDNDVVIAAGYFATAGGTQVNNIALWDGTSWTALGSGMNGAVHSLARLANGDLVAGGYFTMAGGVSANSVARWNGTNWSPLGPGTTGRVYSLLALANGDVIAGGTFSHIGGISGLPVGRIARWNGVGWSALGTGLNGDEVWSIAELLDGDLVVGGRFNIAGGMPAEGIARWNGSAWSPLEAVSEHS